jgi:photosystem II stability/assembly factor-like uncharacterized protein
MNTFSGKAQSTFWEQTDGPTGGYISSLLVRSEDSIFVGTRYGLYRTADGGRHWDLQADVPAGFIAQICESGDSGLFLTFMGPRNYIQGGLMRSTDAGFAWDTLAREVTHDTLPSIAGAGKDCIILETRTHPKVYSRSTDGGDSWFELPEHLSLPHQSHAGFDADGNIYILGTDTLWMSTDDGNSWDSRYLSIGQSHASSFLHAVSGRMYLVVSRSASPRATVYASDDNGHYWSRHGDGFNTIGGGILQTHDSSIFVRADAYLFRAADQRWRADWTAVSANHTEPFAVFRGGILAVEDYRYRTPRGYKLTYSLDRGSSWTELPAQPPSAEVRLLHYLNDKLYCVTKDNRFISSDHGASWTEYSPGEFWLLGETASGRLISKRNDSLFQSDDGKNWLYSGRVLPDGTGEIHVMPTGALYYIGFDRQTWPGSARSELRYSLNGGGSWGHGPYIPEETVFHGLPDGTVLMGHSGIHRTTDEGRHWEEASVEPPAGSVYCIASVGDSLLLAGASAGRILFSYDDGESWSTITVLPDDLTIQSLIVDPQGNFYAGTREEGVYRSSDQGKTWLKWNLGQYHQTVADFTLDTEGHLYAGTIGGGVYRSAEAILSAPEISTAPESFTLEHNYPNPFNPSTNIGFSIPHRGDVRLTVLDHLGRIVAVLAEGEFQKGKHSCQFINTNHPSGMYMYRLSWNGKTMARKMVLLR